MRSSTTARLANDPDFAEIDELRRLGILTEVEYRDARGKLAARQQFEAVAADPLAEFLAEDAGDHSGSPQADSREVVSHAALPRHAAVRGRHAKQPTRWPWIAGSFAVLIVAVAVGIALRPAAHQRHPVRHAAPAPQTSSHSPAIVVASPANTPMGINLDGADAQIAVSKLVAVGRPASQVNTYLATVTVSGQSGSFAIDPAEFSAHSQSGHSYAVAAGPYTTLHTTTVAGGQRTTGSIAFTVPATERIAVVLFTTPLGEQLGLWSTS